MSTTRPDLEALREETLVINMGPQHPSTHGVLRLVLELDGETVVSCRPVIGYLHTGIEKNTEYRTWQQGVTFVTRMDYLANFFNELAYCSAVERLLGIEVPERARVIRVMMCELNRISSHLVWLATTGLELGAISVMLYGFREREVILDVFEIATGLRLNYSYLRIGGLAMDLPDAAGDRVREFLNVMPGRIAEYEELLSGNPIWIERTRGIGYVPPERSLRIVQQCLDRLPEGPVKIDDPKLRFPGDLRVGPDGIGNSEEYVRHIMDESMEALINHFKLATEGISVPAGEVLQAVEGPRGELACYVVSDGGARPYRVHMRDPSFVNLQALPDMVQGALVADVVAAISSVDPVMGGVDR
jgi:NADH-quinone oxidoreductase subunit D